MAFIDVTNNAQLLTAINSTAVAGDVIRCAAGNYGSVILNKDFASKVTIMSTDLNYGAVISEMDLNGATNLAFEKIFFRYTGSSAAPYGVLAGSTLIEFNFCDFQSTNIIGGYPVGNGMNVYNSSYVKFIGCRFDTWRNGIVNIQSNHVEIMGCEFSILRSDGVDIYECSDISIEGCYFHDFRAWYEAGDHCDAIQMFCLTETTFATSNITIKYNVIHNNLGTTTQCIFLRNEAVDFYGRGTSLYYNNIVIENNWVKSSFLYGLNLGESNNISVKNNAFIWELINAGDTCNAALLASGEHQGAYSEMSVPKVNMGAMLGTRVVTDNTCYDAPFSSLPRFLFNAGTSGWTVSNNTVNNGTGTAPAKPAFVLGSNGQGSIAPVTVTGTGVTGRTVVFSKV